MLDLRELIIQRIEEAQGLSARIANYLSESIPPATLDTQFQVNRSILKVLAKYKRRERERTNQEEDLFVQLKELHLWNAKSLEQFYKISLAILGKYDPAVFSFLETGQSLPERLRVLYHAFIDQHMGGIAPKKIQAALQRISQASPILILEWICSWTRDLLSEKIQQSMTAQFVRHEEEMKRISHFRSSAMAQKERQSSPCAGPLLILSNKESVFGLFLEEITNYYRFLPLELDFTFIKSIRKVHSKGDELNRPQNLQKAADILIEAKNKYIKQGREQYRQEFQDFLQRCPSFKSMPQYEAISEKISISQNNKGDRRYKRKAQFERVKSQSKQQQSDSKPQNRGSLLLCPKTNQISFESSKEIMARLRKQKDRKDLQLPDISQGRMAVSNSRSTAVRTKPIRSFFGPVNRSLISNYDRALKNSQQITPKHYEFKQPISIQKLLKKNNNYSCTSGSRQEIALQQEALGRRMDGEELKRNRKLMLQLLREKNKHAFLEK